MKIQTIQQRRKCILTTWSEDASSIQNLMQHNSSFGSKSLWWNRESRHWAMFTHLWELQYPLKKKMGYNGCLGTQKPPLPHYICFIMRRTKFLMCVLILSSAHLFSFFHFSKTKMPKIRYSSTLTWFVEIDFTYYNICHSLAVLLWQCNWDSHETPTRFNTIWLQNYYWEQN